MNARALLLVVPAALAVGLLAGCGQTEDGSVTRSGSSQVKMPSTEVCTLPTYVRKHAPEGLCTESPEVWQVDDYVSPVTGK